MKLTLYKSLLTGRKTMLVASFGQCGHEGYKEVQVMLKHGLFNAVITDGFGYKTDYKRFETLKAALKWAAGA